MDEIEPTSGRGWVILEDGKQNGLLLLHRGDESGFKSLPCFTIHDESMK